MRTENDKAIEGHRVVFCNCGSAMMWLRWYDARKATVYIIWRCPSCKQVVLDHETEIDIYEETWEAEL